jgi:multiple sugar transport system substrate-binding protein
VVEREVGMVHKPYSRREFLRTTAGAAVAAGLGAACRPSTESEGDSSGSSEPSGGKKDLKILQWSHFVPAYDEWFDGEYITKWGDENGINVVVDHINFAEIPARAAAEVSAQKGHDLFWFLSAPAAFEDEVIDHTDIVREVEGKAGKMIGVCERSTFNSKTKKFFGFADNWVPDPVHYRKDLWDEVGYEPTTWENVLKAGPGLKELGNPLGIGISQDIDANMALIAMMQCFESFIQDEEANLTINSPETIEAVNMGAEIYKAGMTPEVFAWDATSNNRFLESGKGSMILNAISGLRTIEANTPDLAKDVFLAPVPEGTQRLGLEHLLGVYVIWKFSEQKEMAQKFLVDLALNYREAFVNSQFYNFPSFPGTVKDLEDLLANDKVSDPPGKYKILAGFDDFSVNVGYPGTVNAAIDELFGKFLVPQMFAEVARGNMSAEDSVKAAETEMSAIYDKWREQGKI